MNDVEGKVYDMDDSVITATGLQKWIIKGERAFNIFATVSKAYAGRKKKSTKTLSFELAGGVSRWRVAFSLYLAEARLADTEINCRRQ